MTRPSRVVLIGPMAAGKSTVGFRLAQQLGVDFVDSDHVFESKHGPISAVFDSLGEHFFRQAEARIIAQALMQDSLVLSLGGGAVLDAGTQQLLSEEFVVYLKTDVHTVEPFILKDRRRPLLSENPLQAWQNTFERRRYTYERLASVSVDVSCASSRDPDEAAAQIVALMNNHKK